MDQNPAQSNQDIQNPTPQAPPAPVIPASEPGSINTNPPKPVRKFSLKLIFGIIIAILLVTALACFIFFKPQILSFFEKQNSTPTSQLNKKVDNLSFDKNGVYSSIKRRITEVLK